MATTIRDLLVSIGVDVKGAKQLKQLDHAVQAFKASIGALNTVLGGAVRGIASFAQETADAGDEAAKAANRMGLSIETVQELGHAAAISGANFREVETGIRRMASSAVDASKGVGEAVDTFGDIGIKSSELNSLLSDQEALFLRVAEGIAGIEDAPRRLAAANDIFGRSGSRLLPLINEGADGIAALRQEARDLGIVMDLRAGKAAERFNDNLERLQALARGLRMQIGNALIPVVADMAQRLREWFLANRAIVRQALDRVIAKLVRGLKILERTVKGVDRIVRESLGGWGSIIDGLQVAFAGLVGTLAGTALVSGIAAVALAIAAYGGPVVLGAVAAIAGIALGFTLLALALDDLAGFAAGDKSLLELILGVDDPKIRESLDIFGAIRDLLRSIKMLGGELVELFGVELSGSFAGLSVGDLVLGRIRGKLLIMKALIDAINRGVILLSSTLSGLNSAGGILRGTGQAGALDRLQGLAGGLGAGLAPALPGGGMLAGAAGFASPASVAGSTSTTRTAALTQGDTTINMGGSTADPEGAARRLLAEQNRNARQTLGSMEVDY